jgi:hypothetical protein
MEILLLPIIWTLCLVIALSKIDNLGLDTWWKAILFFLLAPVLNLVIFIGWGVKGYMSKDWENLL